MGRVGLLRSAKENTLFMFDSHVSCNLKKRVCCQLGLHRLQKRIRFYLFMLEFHVSCNFRKKTGLLIGWASFTCKIQLDSPRAIFIKKAGLWGRWARFAR